MVIFKEKTRVAQYGQWDGYPGGQGATIIKFINHLLLSGLIPQFKVQILKCKFRGKKENKERDEFMKSIGVKDGWMTGEQAAAYRAAYPLASRDLGAGILEAILNSTEKTIWLDNESAFVADSLFCEYAYVIDLDKGNLEVYKGFNTKRVPKGQRFDSVPRNKEPVKTTTVNGSPRTKYALSKYYPVTLAKIYKLKELPTVDQMSADIDGPDEKEVA